MKRSWEKDLPRKQYEQFKKIEQSQPWFTVYDIGHNVYAIYEPYQFQEVISYLIMGEEKAILWDTGNGIGDMKQLVNELWNKEVIVVNSHSHFDHVGSNYQFDVVHVFNHPTMIHIMEHGIDQEVIDSNYGPETYSYQSPIDYQPMSYRRCNYQTFDEDVVFDLGRRRFRVLHTPGHSMDSIMLVNDDEKLLFTGDTYYPAQLYCFTEGTFDAYVQTMVKLANLYIDYTLVTSHNEPIREGNVLKEVAEFFQNILDNKISYKEVGDLKEYEWKTLNLLKK